MGGADNRRALRPGTIPTSALREDVRKQASDITLPLKFVKKDGE
jgi:hypothetical protein